MSKSKTASPEQVDATKTRRRIEDALRKGAGTEELIRVAEALNVEVALIPEKCPCGDAGRPCFGLDQVRCRHQLKKGLAYFDVHSGTPENDPFRRMVEVISAPYQLGSSGWWVRVRVVDGAYNNKCTRSLCDMSLIPDVNGRWNQHNYFAFTDESKHLGCGCHHNHCSRHHCC